MNNMNNMISSASPLPVAQAELTSADVQKRFVIELFTGRSLEQWLAANAALVAAAGVRQAARREAGHGAGELSAVLS